uniref:ubiquitinyl hydrolase 1 n=1 Tax=Aegilops tauschii subsp. strangulata TaxID=200361 RepID=A0A453S5P2_AEGTS
MVLQTSQNGCRKILQKEPLSSLPHEFENEIMKDKAKKLLANYSEYRKVPGDGSCFYRSFIYSYLEQLVKVSHEEELRLLGALEPMWEKFQRLHLPGSYSDLHDAFVGFILECMEQKQKLSVRWVCINIFATINCVAYLCYKFCCRVAIKSGFSRRVKMSRSLRTYFCIFDL